MQYDITRLNAALKTLTEAAEIGFKEMNLAKMEECEARLILDMVDYIIGTIERITSEI